VTDPIFTPAAGAKAAGLAAKYGWPRVRRWWYRDKLKRLAGLLGKHFDADPSIASSGFEYIKNDDEVAEQISTYLEEGKLDRPTLARAIAPHLDPDGPETAVDRAAKVVKAIERLSPRLFSGDERLTFEVRRAPLARDDQTGTRAYVALTFDWTPQEARLHVEEFAKTHQEEGARLVEALGKSTDLRATVADLLQHPPDWVSSGSAELSRVLGRLAVVHGHWTLAQQAFLEAADRGLEDRAGALAQAAEAALAAGDEAGSDEILTRAQALEPTNAAVALLTAKKADEPAAILEILSHATPKTPRGEAAIAATRSLSLAALGRSEEAVETVAHARELDPDSFSVLEAEATVALVVAARGRENDSYQRALRSVPSTFLLLADELESVGRKDEATRMRARAIEAYIGLYELRKAGTLLDEVARGPELDGISEEARLHLADVAITLDRRDLLPSIVPDADPTGEEGRLIQAQIDLTTDKRPHGLATLDALVKSSDDSVRSRAALARLYVAVDDPEVAWSERAEDVLGEAHGEIAAGLKALRLASEGDVTQAENILLSLTDPRGQELLVDLADENGDLELALERLAALVKRAPAPRRRLRYADMLLEAGEPAKAREELALLRADDDLPEEVAVHARRLSTKEAHDAGRYGDAAAFAAEWLELAPNDPMAPWARIDSLLRLGDYDEAWAFYKEQGPTPRDLGEAHAAAHLLIRRAPRPEAVREIAALSDRFDREDVQLEGLLVAAYQRPGEELPRELEERAAAALNEFPERFPESRVARLEIDEFESYVREHYEATKQQLAELSESIQAGRLPASTMALTVGEAASGVWASLALQPLDFADPGLREAERRDAANAITRGAVLDPSALGVVSGLPDRLIATIRNALPQAVVSQAVLEDASFAARDVVPGDPAHEMTHVSWDEEHDQPIFIRTDPETVAAQRERVGRVFRLAGELTKEADVDKEHPTRFDDYGEGFEGAAKLVAATIPSTLAVAERLGLPVYSDDRVVRLVARNEGLPAFGTVALLDAMADRGLISHEQRLAARAFLRQEGGLGLGFDNEDELIAELERAEFKLSYGLAHALLDPASWRRDVDDFDLFLTLLERVCRDRPELFSEWVARVIDAAARARPREGLELQLVRLIGLSLLNRDSDFAQALLAEIRRLTGRDPLPRTIAVVMGITEPFPLEVKSRFGWAMLSRMSVADQLRAVAGVERSAARIIRGNGWI
jgi:hypothetical protein